jgi:hypothetical protein
MVIYLVFLSFPFAYPGASTHKRFVGEPSPLSDTHFDLSIGQLAVFSASRAQPVRLHFCAAYRTDRGQQEAENGAGWALRRLMPPRRYATLYISLYDI